MSLPSGAHLSIDGVEFQIYEQQDLPFPYYSHNLEPIFVGRQDITGKPGRQNVRPDLLYWAFDDWSGGEGNKIFDPEQPSTYNTGHGNPRNPGYLTGVPKKSESTQTVAGAGTAFVEGNSLTNHAGTPENDGFDKRLPEQNDEVKWTGRTPGAVATTVQMNLKPMSYRTETFQGSSFSTIAGSPTVEGSNIHLDSVGDIVRLASRTSGRNTQVRLGFVIFDNTHDRYGQSSQTYTVKAIRSDTSAVIVSTSGVVAHGQVFPVLEFVAPSHNYHIQVEFTSSGAGDVPEIVLDHVLEEWWDGSSTSVVRVRRMVPSDAATNSTYNGVTAATHTVEIAGPTTVTLTFTGVAGETYDYRAQNNDTNHDTLIVDLMAETTTNNFLGDIGMVETRGAVWAAFGVNVLRSTDGVTWENRELNTAPTAGMKAISMAADDSYVYVLYHSNPVVGQTGSIEIHRLTETLTAAKWTNTKMFDGTPGNPGWKYPLALAAAPAIKRLYMWSVHALTEFDTSAAANWTREDVHDPFVNESTDIIAGITVVDDNSVCYFASTTGHSVVYQFKNGVGRTLWFLPGDFTARTIEYSQGVLFLAGGDSAGAAPGIRLYALNLRSEQSTYLGKFHEVNTIIPVSSCPGAGSSFLIGCSVGHVVVYDIEKAAFSMLDNPGGGSIKSVGSFLGHNIVAIALNASQVKMVSYRPDSTAGYGTFENTSGLWDFDFPEAEKVLQGFVVVTKPLAAGSSVEIFYRLDNAGGFISAGTVTTAGAVRTFLPAPTGTNTVKFDSLEVRKSGDQGTAQEAPVIYSVTTQASINEKVETWDLALRAYHEDVDRPDSSSRRAEEVRDSLLNLADSGQIVQFKDGYRKERESSTTHSVIVENPQDIVQKNSEGFIRVRLRKVA